MKGVPILMMNSGDSVDFDTVTIGGQIWMAYNMDIDDAGAGIYDPNGSSGNVASYGRLYTLAAAQRIAATISGWRVPTRTDFQTLDGYITPSSGGKMKETGTTYFQTPNTGATNSVNFNGRAAGSYNSIGFYSNFYTWNQFLTSTSAGGSNIYMFILKYDDANLSEASTATTSNAYSVRLIKE